MKKFLKKTMNSITVGYESVMDMTGAKKLQEDPEFLSRVEKFQFYDEKLKSMHRSLIGLSASLSNLGNSQKEISQYYFENFENRNPNDPDNEILQITSQKYNELSELTVELTGASSINITGNFLSEIEEIIKEINHLKILAETRRKHFILKQNNEAKIQKISAKNQPVPDELNEELQKQKNKLTTYHQQFISGVDSLEEKIQIFYKKLLDNTQTVIDQTFSQLHEKAPHDLKPFSISGEDAQFPEL